MPASSPVSAACSGSPRPCAGRETILSWGTKSERLLSICRAAGATPLSQRAVGARLPRHRSLRRRRNRRRMDGLRGIPPLSAAFRRVRARDLDPRPSLQYRRRGAAPHEMRRPMSDDQAIIAAVADLLHRQASRAWGDAAGRRLAGRRITAAALRSAAPAACATIPSGSLGDIGCGYGELLRHIRSKGLWQPLCRGRYRRGDAGCRRRGP